MLIAIIAGFEALLYSAARSKRGRARRQQLLMGTSTDLKRAVPLVDNYLKQKTVEQPDSSGSSLPNWQLSAGALFKLGRSNICS